MDLYFCIRHYGGSAFHVWLSKLWNTGFAHGADLADSLHGTDNNHAADRLLSAAVEAGWILQAEKASPTFSQRAFIGLERKRKAAYTYPREHGYAPNRAHDGALEYVRHGLKVVP